MAESNGKPDDFPDTESFRDCCGNLRTFDLDLNVTEGGYFLRATEQSRGDGGYRVAAHSETSPYLALGALRAKIRKYLSVRYLTEEYGRKALSHGTALGFISYGGLIIDGDFIPFEEFVDILQTYEGWELSLNILSGFDKA